MARARNLKPGFFHNEQLVELPFEDRLLFAGLWTVSDRAGRLENRAKKIKMQLFPADDVQIDVMLSRLADAELITLYNVDNIQYIQIDNFEKHQNPHCKEAVSTIPPPTNTVQAQCKHGANPADSLLPITDSLNPINNTTQFQTVQFEKPTIQECIDYCGNEKHGSDFYLYYESIGWVVGRAKNKMKNWKTALTGWCNRAKERANENSNSNSKNTGAADKVRHAISNRNNSGGLHVVE